MNADQPAIETKALDWVIRVQRDDFVEWDPLTDWLTADPRHGETFDRLSAETAEAIETMRTAPPPPRPAIAANANEGPAIVDRPWMRMAASILLPVAVAGGIFAYHAARPQPALPLVAIQTEAGKPRDVDLGNGIQVDLSGGTSLSFDRQARVASLDTGRATFTVVHDPAHPFQVKLGNVTVTDVGTVFDLHRWSDGAEIAVAKGSVSLDGAGAPLSVSAGQIVRIAGGAMTRPQPIVPDEVGSWRHGNLYYANATIAAIASDLGSATGVPVRVTPAVARRRFAGTLVLGTNADATMRVAAPLMGVSARRTGTGWELDAPEDAGTR